MRGSGGANCGCNQTAQAHATRRPFCLLAACLLPIKGADAAAPAPLPPDCRTASGVKAARVAVPGSSVRLRSARVPCEAPGPAVRSTCVTSGVAFRPPGALPLCQSRTVADSSVHGGCGRRRTALPRGEKGPQAVSPGGTPLYPQGPGAAWAPCAHVSGLGGPHWLCPPCSPLSRGASFPQAAAFGIPLKNASSGFAITVGLAVRVPRCSVAAGVTQCPCSVLWDGAPCRGRKLTLGLVALQGLRRFMLGDFRFLTFQLAPAGAGPGRIAHVLAQVCCSTENRQARSCPRARGQFSRGRRFCLLACMRKPDAGSWSSAPPRVEGGGFSH